MRIFDLGIAAAVVALVGVAVWVFVLGGPSGDSDAQVSQPPGSEAGPPPDAAENRLDCDAIRGTDYLSPEERTWFLANCSGSAADQPSPPSPATPSANQPPPTDTPMVSGDGPPPTVLPVDEPLVPPPPAPPTPTPRPAEPAPQPPSDDDLYYEFTRFGFTSGAFFYVYFENQDPNWAVCDLMIYVEYHYERLDGSIPLGRTEPTTVSYLAPLEGIEGHTLGGGGAYPFRLLDYTLFLDWDWC